MSFEIEALKGYFGGKGGSGQQIINIIPPHDTFIVPFLGHCGITRNIKPCQNWYLNDIDKSLISKWRKHKRSNKKVYAKSTTILNKDWRQMLPPQMDRKDVVIYLDPPYLQETRSSEHKYKHELSNLDHIELLDRVQEFDFAKVIISTYENALYQDQLEVFNSISFPSMTRRGIAIETVYFNFEPPDILHDWRYMGNDFRERHDYKKKRKNMVEKFERMTALEQNYFMNALQDSVTVNI